MKSPHDGTDAGPINPDDLTPLLEGVRLMVRGLPAPPLPAVGDGPVATLAREIAILSDTLNHRADEMREAVRKIRFERDRLEDVGEEREKELAQARQRVETGDKLRAEFIANINHNLRTPLTSIIGFSALLQTDEGTELAKRREYVDIIHQEGERLLGMVEALIDLSRINAGDFALIARFFNLNNRIKTEFPRWEERGRRMGVSIAIALDDRLDGLFADPDLTVTMLDKLVVNAIDHSPPQSRVTVRTVNEGENALIEVSDQGPGIPPDMTETIFQNFVRHNKPSGSMGLGLGLSLVRSIAWAHFGAVEVESREGGGAAFRVRLPLAPTAPLPSVDDPTAPSIWPGPGGGRKILIADDDAHSRRLVLSMLRDRFQILEARDGEETLDMCRKFRPDLALIDLTMPVMDGFAAMRALRDDPRTSHIPLLAVSARTAETDVDEAYLAGASSFISKPFKKAELTHEIDSLIRAIEEWY
jgi:signal transduction histidine kinase